MLSWVISQATTTTTTTTEKRSFSQSTSLLCSNYVDFPHYLCAVFFFSSALFPDLIQLRFAALDALSRAVAQPIRALNREQPPPQLSWSTVYLVQLFGMKDVKKEALTQSCVPLVFFFFSSAPSRAFYRVHTGHYSYNSFPSHSYNFNVEIALLSLRILFLQSCILRFT